MKNLICTFLLLLAACSDEQAPQVKVSTTPLSYYEAQHFCYENGGLPRVNTAPYFMHNVSDVPTAWFFSDDTYGFVYDRQANTFRITAVHEVLVEAFAVCF